MRKVLFLSALSLFCVGVGVFAAWFIFNRAAHSAGRPEDDSTLLLSVSVLDRPEALFHDADADRMIASHITFMSDPEILNAVVEDPTVQASSWYAPYKGSASAAASALKPLLSIKRVPDTHLIAVHVTVPSSADASCIANALGESYQKACLAIAQERANPALMQLAKKSTELQADLEESLTVRLHALEGQLGELGVSTDGRFNEPARRLQELDGRASPKPADAQPGAAAVDSTLGADSGFSNARAKAIHDLSLANNYLSEHEGLTQTAAHLRTQIEEIRQRKEAMNQSVRAAAQDVTILRRAHRDVNGS